MKLLLPRCLELMQSDFIKVNEKIKHASTTPIGEKELVTKIGFIVTRSFMPTKAIIRRNDNNVLQYSKTIL